MTLFVNIKEMPIALRSTSRASRLLGIRDLVNLIMRPAFACRTAWHIKQLQRNRPRSKIKSLNTSSSIAALSRKCWKSVETSCSVLVSFHALCSPAVCNVLQTWSPTVVTVDCGPIYMDYSSCCGCCWRTLLQVAVVVVSTLWLL